MSEYLILDGYNVIHAWPALKERMDELSLEDARETLMDWMIELKGASDVQIVVVFDAHSSPNATALPVAAMRGNVTQVYTAREQTADSYIEALVEQLRWQDKRMLIRVVTGDALEQGTVLSFGGTRMTVKELRLRYQQMKNAARGHMAQLRSAARQDFAGRLPAEIAAALETMRRSK